MNDDFTPKEPVSEPEKKYYAPQKSANAVVPFVLGCFTAVIVSVLLVVMGFAAMFGAMGKAFEGMSSAVKTDFGGSKSGNVALVRVEGEITSGTGGGIFADNDCGAETIVECLDDVKEDKSVRGVILRIDSPGGSAAASEEVYNAVMRLRKSGKKVYTSMGGTAASGGYYIAAASDRIFADASTLTGSIGVIMSGADLSELYKKIGYSPNTIKSGKFKDIGTANRPMTDEERQLLQNMIDDVYNTFLTDVSKGRNIPVETLRPIADGRIFTGKTAKAAGLVDEIGGLYETEMAMAKELKIKEEDLDVFEYESDKSLRSLLGIKFDGGARKLLGNLLLSDAVNDLVKSGDR